jgi:hypothetical protein
MTDEYDFSGVWRSTYHKIGKDLQTETDQYVTLQRIGNQLVLESIPGASSSYLIARFTIDGRIATGSYQSQNSPHSEAKGAIYYGAAQLIIDEDGKALRGKGIGYAKDMTVKVTEWEVVRVGQKPKDIPEQ